MMDMFKMLQDPNFAQGFASIGPTLAATVELLGRIATALEVIAANTTDMTEHGLQAAVTLPDNVQEMLPLTVDGWLAVETRRSLSDR